MNAEKILAIFVVFGTLFILWKLNRASYLFSPRTIIGYQFKKLAFSLHFIFSIIIAAAFHFTLDKVFPFNDKLDLTTSTMTLVIITEVIFFILLIGILINRYFSSTNQQFSEWRKSRKFSS